MLTHTMKAAFAVITLAVALPSQGAITVQHFDGAPGNLPIQIGSATIEYEYSPEDSGYYKFGLHATSGGFGWYELPSGSCVYWFHSSDLPDIENLTTILVESYPSVYAVAGYTKAGSSIVDGAEWSDDNYISYYDANGVLIAVMRIGFTEGTEDVRLLGLAYDLDGMTFRDGITALVPEPSAAVLLGLGAAGAAFFRRRS